MPGDEPGHRFEPLDLLRERPSFLLAEVHDWRTDTVRVEVVTYLPRLQFLVSLDPGKTLVYRDGSAIDRAWAHASNAAQWRGAQAVH